LTVSDNFGMLLAGLVVPLQTGSFTKDVSGFITTLGLSKTLTIWGTNPAVNFNSANQNRAQVGKGNTPATRQDIKIESAFASSPESDLNVSQAFGYNSGLGKVSVATQIAPTGGAGTITEIVKINNLKDNAGGALEYLFTRDVIVGVGFIIGQTIDTEHIFLI